jgi:hypothetical protein
LPIGATACVPKAMDKAGEQMWDRDGRPRERRKHGEQDGQERDQAEKRSGKDDDDREEERGGTPREGPKLRSLGATIRGTAALHETEPVSTVSSSHARLKP